MNKISWSFDPSQTINQFLVEVSTDKGLTFATLATIAFDVTGVNYNRQMKRFFYSHNDGAPGDIYRVTVVGPFGSSEPVLIVAPATAPTTCQVIGYMRDVLGFVDEQTPIHVSAFGTAGERWISNPAGLVAQNAQALGIISRDQTIFPDANGMWSIDLVRKTYARIEIPALNFLWTFEVPDQAGPVNIRDIPQLRGQALALFGSQHGERFTLHES